jgi:hypothetical protein
LAVTIGSGTGDPGARTDDGAPSATPIVTEALVAPGQPFTLGVGETAVLEGGLVMTFAAVVGDSRCPADVQCVWEGNAEIAIDTAQTGEPPARLILNTNPGFATEAVYLSYVFELIALDPYPRTEAETDGPDRVTLVANLAGVDPGHTPETSPPPATFGWHAHRRN